MIEPGVSKRIHVAVGVIFDSHGRVLIAKRADQQHLGGLWEFPGGKLEPGESVQQALYRELKEELAIEVDHSRPLCRIEHNYPDKAVLLDVWIVDGFTGTPTGEENQPLRWLLPTRLEPADFPQANRQIIRRLQLCDMLAIINLPAPMPELLRLPDNTLLRLRCQHKNQYTAYLAAVQQFLQGLAAEPPALILDLSANGIDGDGQVRDDMLNIPGIKGLHAYAGLLANLSARPVPDHLLFGVSCHNRQDLVLAQRLDADYALLSPVQTTATHPDTAPLGWDTFAALTRETSVPVYALGGMRAPDLVTACTRGARGIAGISLFNCDTMR